MALTVKSTPLKSGGGYTTTTPTLSPGAGRMKPFGSPGAHRHSVLHEVQSPYYRGRRGSNPDTQALLKNVERTITS